MKRGQILNYSLFLTTVADRKHKKEDGDKDDHVIASNYVEAELRPVKSSINDHRHRHLTNK